VWLFSRRSYFSGSTDWSQPSTEESKRKLNRRQRRLLGQKKEDFEQKVAKEAKIWERMWAGQVSVRSWELSGDETSAAKRGIDPHRGHGESLEFWRKREVPRKRTLQALPPEMGPRNTRKDAKKLRGSHKGHRGNIRVVRTDRLRISPSLLNSSFVTSVTSV
jgi:hypothetical protein